MKKPVEQHERAKRAWDILVGHARERKATTYGELGAEMNVHHRVCSPFLGLIQDHCMSSNLPPLPALVVNKSTGIPGKGYIATVSGLLTNCPSSKRGFRSWLRSTQPRCSDWTMRHGTTLTVTCQKVLQMRGQPSLA